jgi:hypothetical protein
MAFLVEGAGRKARRLCAGPTDMALDEFRTRRPRTRLPLDASYFLEVLPRRHLPTGLSAQQVRMRLLNTQMSLNNPTLHL